MKDKKTYSAFAAFVILLVFFSTGHSIFAQTLLWNDEFDGTSLDLAKWEVFDEVDWSAGGETSWFAPHNIEVSSGILKLYNQEESYKDGQWTGAHIDALYYPQYKYLEARVRHSEANTHIWATWWTVGWTGSTWAWPPEFDICEYQGDGTNKDPGQWYHYGSGGGDYDGSGTGLNETEWHTYGVYWSETQNPTFYVDGIISSIPGGDPTVAHMAAKLKLTTSPNRDSHYSGCPLATMEVDYVRVYDAPPAQPITASNLALNIPATASSLENSGFPASNAVDGIDVSRWASEHNIDPQWLQVDLGDTYTIDKVKIYWQYASAIEYKVQIADSPTGPWTDCVHVTNSYDYEHWRTLAFAPQTGRYVRVYCMQRRTEWGYSIFELEVYQDCEGADIDGDGIVDISDLGVLTSYWLEPNCNAYNDCDGADIYDDNKIDFLDFSIFAEYWQCNTCSTP
ncbi:MAG: galactose-binding domain-containing protein [Planctomycetota bacterium]